MDLMTIFGATFGVGAVYYVLAHGGMLKMILNLEAIILIFGGTLGSVMISYPWSALKWIPSALRMILIPPKRADYLLLIRTLAQLAEKAKRAGIESLQSELPRLPHPFLADGVQMLLDSLEAEVIRERCERDILVTRHRHLQLSGIFRSAGTFSPIFGLLGTLVGVVQVLKNITNPQTMGASMAIAMTASFYGIFAANFLFLPIAGKLDFYSEEEIVARELIAKGVLAIQQGEVPWMIYRRLEAYLAYNLRRRAREPVKS
ncbi:MAG: MotA/TolQ/ExbB proton channel family protein [Elusimicrobia bacterium]|nr:MotA/TolQ/ExbB proton channel family protein [Elusimicrobiota bacterium]